MGCDLDLPKLSTRAFVEGSYAQIEFIQTYKNPHDEPIETEFLFPRTDSSIFHKFEAVFRDKTVTGQIFEKEEAKQMYKESLEQGHTAAYSERNANTPDIMKILVGNISGGESVEIKFSIIEPLDLVANKLWSLTLPVVLTERYTLSSSHLERQSDDIAQITNVQMEDSKYKEWYVYVEVKANSPFEIISNPSHNLEPKMYEETSKSVNNVYKAVWNATLTPDKNFAIYFKPENIQDVGTILAKHETYPNDYALLVNFVSELNTLKYSTLKEALQDVKEGFLKLKKLALEHDKINARAEFIFIIDRSGSMQGGRIQNLKRH